MQPRHLEAILFSAKAALASVVAALGYHWLPLPGAMWMAAVSAVLVTQPNLHSSLKLSLLRVIANLAGAFGGAALLVATGHHIPAMACGVMITGLVCFLLKQDDGLRPAFVAVIIVTLIGDSNKWQASLDRVLAVVVGCVCALVVGFLFDKLADASKLWRKAEPGERGRQE